MTTENGAGVCPRCPRGCPLDAPGCLRGEIYARSLSSGAGPELGADFDAGPHGPHEHDPLQERTRSRIPTATSLPRPLQALTTAPADMGTAIRMRPPRRPTITGRTDRAVRERTPRLRRRTGTGLTAGARGRCRRSRRRTGTASRG